MDGTYFYIMAAVTGLVLCLTFIFIVFSFFYILYNVVSEKGKNSTKDAMIQGETDVGMESLDQEKISRQRLQELCIDLEEVGLK